jgi:hypothetical protein
MRLAGTGSARPVKQPNRVTHLFRVCRIIIFDGLSSFFSVGCDGGMTLGDALGGFFLQDASPGWGPGARGRGPGAGNSISLGGREGTAPASDTTPDSEAVVWVVGLGFHAIEDSIGSPLILV